MQRAGWPHTPSYLGPTCRHVAEGNATVTLRAEGSVAVQAGLHAPPPLAQQDPRWGAYRQRGAACGMPILAYDCVCQAAVCVAEGVIEVRLVACMRQHLTAV